MIFRIIFVIIAFGLSCANAYYCPVYWPYLTCPRPGEDEDMTICCYGDNGEYECCYGGPTFTPLVIGMLVLSGVVILVGLAACTYAAYWKYSKRTRRNAKREQELEMRTVQN